MYTLCVYVRTCYHVTCIPCVYMYMLSWHVYTMCVYVHVVMAHVCHVCIRTCYHGTCIPCVYTYMLSCHMYTMCVLSCHMYTMCVYVHVVMSHVYVTTQSLVGPAFAFTPSVVGMLEPAHASEICALFTDQQKSRTIISQPSNKRFKTYKT